MPALYVCVWFTPEGPSLKVVSTMSVGFDHLSLEELKKRWSYLCIYMTHKTYWFVCPICQVKSKKVLLSQGIILHVMFGCVSPQRDPCWLYPRCSDRCCGWTDSSSAAHNLQKAHRGYTRSQDVITIHTHTYPSIQLLQTQLNISATLHVAVAAGAHGEPSGCVDTSWPTAQWVFLA